MVLTYCSVCHRRQSININSENGASKHSSRRKEQILTHSKQPIKWLLDYSIQKGNNKECFFKSLKTFIFKFHLVPLVYQLPFLWCCCSLIRTYLTVSKVIISTKKKKIKKKENPYLHLIRVYQYFHSILQC